MYAPTDSPLTYCLNDTMDRGFLHGGHADTFGQHSRNCQLFMSEYCAEQWDEICEFIESHGGGDE